MARGMSDDELAGLPRIVSLTQVAKAIGRNPAHVREWAANGTLGIPTVHQGDRLVVTRHCLWEFLGFTPAEKAREAS